VLNGVWSHSARRSRPAQQHVAGLYWQHPRELVRVGRWRWNAQLVVLRPILLATGLTRGLVVKSVSAVDERIGFGGKDSVVPNLLSTIRSI
jgi:hypothetical protein